ncbi:L-alanine-DL-glutamate epimerase-like enolase superfamily enzyme [Microbacterium sp. AK009]|nr:L-alanine-DL-glutamate epimerase-like enolase superfamily enzyme [Microbacterium sp. AK009]
MVAVELEDGTVGIGEASPYGIPAMIADWVEWLSRDLIGADLFNDRAVPRPNGTATIGRVGSSHDFAAAGIDCAIWDARGKIRGASVARLLNPDADDRVKVYASGGVRFDWRKDPNVLVEDVRDYVDAGYDTVKVRLGTAWRWDRVTPGRFLDLYDEALAEAGPGVRIAVDANCRLGLEEAIELARGLESRGAPFLEEPFPNTDLALYAELKRHTFLPISGGESFSSHEQYRPWLEYGLLDIVQPDAGVMGITELCLVGRTAESVGVQVIPHSWHNGLMAMANANAVAALPNAPMVEECMVQGPLKWGIAAAGSPVREGSIDLSDRHGLGFELIPDLEQRFPNIEGHYGVEVFRDER